MATFHAVGDKLLRPVYSIDIEEREDGLRDVYFNSEVHVGKRTRIGPGPYGPEFSPTPRFSSSCCPTPYGSSAATSSTARTAIAN